MEAEFTWDPVKAASNVKKHGVSFETAILVFADPNCISDIESHVDGEDRWQTIGRVDHNFVVLVVHTNWNDEELEIIRLISARPAEKQERTRYEEQFGSI
jgi:uncharacterized protein